MTPRKTTSSINPDEAAAAAVKKKAPAKETTAAPPAGDPYTQLALEWSIRRLYEGAARPFARRQVEKDRQLPDEVRKVLLDRLDLMGF